MIQDLETFHKFLGETMMFCQFIEHDVKWIYAGMLGGDYRKNYEEVIKSRLTLGEVVMSLKELDRGNGKKKPYFYSEDYALLSELTRIRNYWAHEGYLGFSYKSGETWALAFAEAAAALEKDHDKLDRTSRIIEEVRLDVLKKLGHI